MIVMTGGWAFFTAAAMFRTISNCSENRQVMPTKSGRSRSTSFRTVSIYGNFPVLPDWKKAFLETFRSSMCMVATDLEVPARHNNERGIKK